MLRIFRRSRKWFAWCGVASALLLSSNGAFAKSGSDTILYSFSDGSFPMKSFIDSAGNIYGYTMTGGASTNCTGGSCGTIFRVAPDGTQTVLYSFNGSPTDGAFPTGIVVAKDGTIYGTTKSGGTEGGNWGTVFKLTPDGQETILYSFPGLKHNAAPDGLFPTGGLIFGHDGNLYGTTAAGGINNHCDQGGCGTVFKITLKGKHTVLYAFKGAGDACQSYSGLTQDQAGNLYGGTKGCGNGNYGTIYKLDPATGVETTLHVFAEGADGNDAEAPPVIDKAGNLYGTTVTGGNTGCGGPISGTGCGIVFKIAADGTYTILYTFVGLVSGGPVNQDGGVAGRPLYIDRLGNLYSTTLEGGNALCNPPYGCGTVWKMTPDGTETILYRFKGPNADDGWLPYDGVIPGPGPDSKNLYGTTGAGPGCCGMIYKIKK